MINKYNLAKYVMDFVTIALAAYQVNVQIVNYPIFSITVNFNYNIFLFKLKKFLNFRIMFTLLPFFILCRPINFILPAMPSRLLHVSKLRTKLMYSLCWNFISLWRHLHWKLSSKYVSRFNYLKMLKLCEFLLRMCRVFKRIMS